MIPPDRPPRWGTPRQLDRPTRGGLDRQVAKLLGWDYFPWQQLAADVAGEYDPLTRIPYHRTVGISVSRQNGKTTLVVSRIARQLIAARQTVAYTAQDRGIARTKWAEHVDLLMDTPFADRVERVERTNHRECLVMQNGSRYMPVTPTAKKAGRSLSIDLAVVDEANSHPNMGVISGLQPTMSTRPFAQLWLLANAGTKDSALWKHYTDIGRLEIGNPMSPICWLEWAASENVDPFDREEWANGNPSLGHPGGVLESSLADAVIGMERGVFLREHLNVWADDEAQVGIDPVVWASNLHPDIRPGVEQLAVSLDFTPERDRGALMLAGMSNDLVALEVLESGADLDRIVQRAADIANRWDCLITVDRGSPAASAIPTLEKLTANSMDGGHRVRVIPSTDYVRACGSFHDAAVSMQLSHRGDYRLTDAVVGATRRAVGDAWVWRRRGSADISPLSAGTCAYWGVVAAPEILVPAVY